MQEILIIANLKMNLVHHRDVVTYCNTIRKSITPIKDLKKGVRLVICPSAPHYRSVQRATHADERVFLGAQDVFWERRGSYTGQISPITLGDSGVKYALVGHSESRKYGHVSDEEIGKKVAALIMADITPVIFIGETEHERVSGHMKDALTTHMHIITQTIRVEDIRKCVFVYEPIWAIGAQSPPHVEDIMSARILMQKILAQAYGSDCIQDIQILYGGSVTPENAIMFTPEVGMEGVVLGRAGTNAHSLLQVAATIAHNFNSLV